MAAPREIASARPGASTAVGAIAAILGAAAALDYHRAGLTLSHYDARGHLVVARRIVDSLTPGWQQIGAVWLPLPHLLNALPVQFDAMYRSGASAVALSIVAFAVAAAAIAHIVGRLTGSTPAAILAAATFGLNPNVVYLQSTPMTEPLLVALTTGAVALLLDWLDATAADPPLAARGLLRRRHLVGAAFALACLTRYEAWPVAFATLAAACWVLERRGSALAPALRQVGWIAVWPIAAILAFLVFSRVVIGQWMVTSGFFVPENKARGAPWLAIAEIAWGTRALSGALLATVAAVGLAGLLLNGLFRRQGASALVALSLGATALVPWAAFVEGHPFRIRYMVPLIPLEAVAVGVAAALPSVLRPRLSGALARPRARLVGALAALAVAVAVSVELRPLDHRAPMVVEAQWDRPNARPRQAVTDYLRPRYRGETIMASMGSLGHYMQEMSHQGFRLRDFLHEGNGDLWLAALEDPRPLVGWVLIEEKAEGGDMLAGLARRNPHFLDGFSRVREGAGVALYERTDLLAASARADPDVGQADAAR